MASDKPTASSEGAQNEEVDLAKVTSNQLFRDVSLGANDTQAFQELARGERTATALEAQLSAMESKIDALLEQAEREQKDIADGKDDGQESKETDKKDEAGSS